MNQIMNRAQRRAEARRKPPKRRHINDGLGALRRSELFNDSEFARLSIEAWNAWDKLCTGSGGVGDYDTMVVIWTVCRVLAEQIKPDPRIALDVVNDAHQAIAELHQRQQRTGKWGVDSAAMRDIPALLQFHDQLIQTCTPAQLVKAAKEAVSRGYLNAPIDRLN